MAQYDFIFGQFYIDLLFAKILVEQSTLFIVNSMCEANYQISIDISRPIYNYTIKE